MREPDDIPVVNPVGYYHKSLDLADELGIRNAWDRFFIGIYRPLEQQGVPFEQRVKLAAEQTNKHFEMRVDAGINENDYV